MSGTYKILSVFSVMVMVLSLGGIINLNTAYAAALQNKSDTLSSSKISTVSNHTIIFRTPSGVDTPADTMTITFDNPGGAFSVPASMDYTDIDLDVSAGAQSSCTGVSFSTSKTLAAAPASATWGATVNNTTDVITLTPPTNATSGEIATNACVRVKVGTNATGGDQQITNPSSASSYIIAIGGVFGDVGNTAVQIISNDQVAVSANVVESIGFSVSSNSIGFGNLDPANARYANGAGTGSATEVEAHNIIVGTNAANGYSLAVNGGTLTYGAYTITPIGASNSVSAPGTKQFGLRASASGGSGTVSAPYAASGFAFDSTAFPDELAASTGASANTTYSLRYLANITSNTEAGAYAATLTYTATANF